MSQVEPKAPQRTSAPKVPPGFDVEFSSRRWSPPPLTKLHRVRKPYKLRLSRPVGGRTKRLFDFSVALFLLTVLAPLLLVFWVLVRMGSQGPGFFRQARGGWRGRPFQIYKFRTMTVCETTKVRQARKHDARTTRLGRFLRASSIDELPQLLNVLKGEMSLVGPRPHAISHDSEFGAVDPRYTWRHRARPGITGLAQVSGSRGPTETNKKVHKRVAHDIGYVTSWSLFLDVKILVMTPIVALRDRNAF